MYGRAQGEADGKLPWKIIFSNGGTGVVLPVFLRLLDKRKKKGGFSRSLSLSPSASH